MWEDDTLCIDYMIVDGTSITVTAKTGNIVTEPHYSNLGQLLCEKLNLMPFDPYRYLCIETFPCVQGSEDIGWHGRPAVPRHAGIGYADR